MAKHSVIRGWLSRYKLVLKSVSKINRLNKQAIHNKKSDPDDDSDDNRYEFIVSEYLATPDDGYLAIHNWVFRQTSGLRDFGIWAKSKLIFSCSPLVPLSLPLSIVIATMFIYYIYNVCIFNIFTIEQKYKKE